MNISRAQQTNLPRILAIQKEAYLSEAAIYEDYSLPPLLQSLSDIEAEFQSKVFLKAEEAGAIVGSVRVHLVDGACVVERLIVNPKFQRRGIGSALLTAAETVFPEASHFQLFTGSRSSANIRLYERHGYVRFKEEFLSPAVTLLHMHKRKAVE